MAGELHGPGRATRGPNDHPAELGSTGTDEPGEPDDLARANRERGVCEAGAGETGYAQHDRRVLRRWGSRRKLGIERAAEHGPDQRRVRLVRGRRAAYQLAVPQ